MILAASAAYCAPKENNGKAKGHETDKPANTQSTNNNGQGHLNNRSNSHKKDSQHKRAIEVEKNIPEADSQMPQKPGNQRDAYMSRETGHTAMLHNLEKSLRKLHRARWAYNPKDTRGQGNMGNVDMLDPFGHDKDSDRKELCGSNSRVIKVIEPEPPPEPELPPEIEPEPPPEDPEPDPPPDPEPPPEPDPDPPF